MFNQEWPASAYAIGSYIQATIAETYLNRLTIQPTDKVLDIGCGNGKFSKKIVEKLPQGSLLGLDASANMLQLAEEIKVIYPNFSTQQMNVLTMNFHEEFDYIVSFWCLQWAQDIHKAFFNIFDVLKKGAKLFALFPVGDDPFIRTYYAIKESQQFPSLAQFRSPVDYSKLDHLEEKLTDIPYKHFIIERSKHQLILPSLEIFRKFVNGIAFFQGQVADEEIPLINEAMVQYYHNECQIKYQGEYQFNLSIYLITGEK